MQTRTNRVLEIHSSSWFGEFRHTLSVFIPIPVSVKWFSIESSLYALIVQPLARSLKPPTICIFKSVDEVRKRIGVQLANDLQIIYTIYIFGKTIFLYLLSVDKWDNGKPQGQKLHNLQTYSQIHTRIETKESSDSFGNISKNISEIAWNSWQRTNIAGCIHFTESGRMVRKNVRRRSNENQLGVHENGSRSTKKIYLNKMFYWISKSNFHNNIPRAPPTKFISSI